jgi:hypothetical protein
VWRIFWLIMMFLTFTLSCQKRLPDNAHLLNQYISAANSHNFGILTDLISENAVWYLGRDTLIGRDKVLSPLRFDEAVNTKLYVRNVQVRGDTVDFDLVEKNGVLYGLGFDSLIHYERFVYSDAKVVLQTSRFPPDPFKTFSDSVVAFYDWLRFSDSLAYREVISEGGKFQYSNKSGKIILDQITKWRKRNQ